MNSLERPIDKEILIRYTEGPNGSEGRELRLRFGQNQHEVACTCVMRMHTGLQATWRVTLCALAYLIESSCASVSSPPTNAGCRPLQAARLLEQHISRHVPVLALNSALDEQLIAKFGLPSSEQLRHDFRCVYHNQTTSVKGRLYVFSQYLCFDGGMCCTHLILARKCKHSFSTGPARTLLLHMPRKPCSYSSLVFRYESGEGWGECARHPAR